MSYKHQNKPKALFLFLKMPVFIVVRLVVLFLEG
jgi:hypothetical protein